MWQFAGVIEHQCDECGKNDVADISDFNIECVGTEERQMGPEIVYELNLDINCSSCGNAIGLNFMAYEYPIEVLNYVENEVSGATTSDSPYIEYLPDLYEAQEFDLAKASASEIIREIQSDPEQLRSITPRQFEEVVAELFRHKGYQVELTKHTRDGGKDIIAISKDHFDIKLKYFIECKHYAETNKVGVDVVRALHGVKNTKNGPNKTIIATTSSFTADAVNFAESEATSSWDITLADYKQIISWIGDYGQTS